MASLEPQRKSSSSHVEDSQPRDSYKPHDTRHVSPDEVKEIAWFSVPLASIISLTVSGFLAFNYQLDTLSKSIFFVALLSIGLGGFASMLGGKATLTMG